MINRERLVAYLIDLLRIDSISRKEGDIARKLAADLAALGAEVTVDGAGAKVGGQTGNVVARVRGTAPNRPPLFLSAHMDTVEPGEGVIPIREGDVIRTDGTTVLGGDDKSGVAVIMEILRTLQERRIPHPPLDIAFTICEEVGLLGAKHFEMDRIAARTGLVLDSDDAGHLVTRGPAENSMEFVIHGLEAHAGMVPEQGISAIRIAADAISRMTLGRIDHETTANVGVIHGGLATNIIPNTVLLKAEARSHDEAKLEAQTRHMCECLEQAAARHTVTKAGVLHTGRVEARIHRAYERLAVPDDALIVQWLTQAAKHLGRELTAWKTGGGCDANIFNQKGMEVANLGTGMRDIHTVKEWLDIKDLYACADLVLETVRVAGTG